MKKIRLTTDLPRHECNAWTEGQTAHFHCPQCGYLRRVDLETHETTLVNQGDSNALHNGAVMGGGAIEETPFLEN